MSTHTPGPWRVGRKVGRTIYAEGMGADGRLIGVMDRIEDARLAAAAPALLDALKLAASCLRRKHFEQGHLDEIKAAIAKAEGMPNQLECVVDALELALFALQDSVNADVTIARIRDAFALLKKSQAGDVPPAEGGGP